MLVDELQCPRVAVAVRVDRRLEDDGAADDLDDRERVRVAVWVDTDHLVQPICEHPRTDLQPSVGDTNRCRSGDENRGRQNCDRSRAQNADRLLIRPTSGRQAGTGLSARTNHWKDTAAAGHSRIESRTKSTDTNLTRAPDGTAHTLTVRE